MSCTAHQNRDFTVKLIHHPPECSVCRRLQLCAHTRVTHNSTCVMLQESRGVQILPVTRLISSEKTLRSVGKNRRTLYLAFQVTGNRTSVADLEHPLRKFIYYSFPSHIIHCTYVHCKGHLKNERLRSMSGRRDQSNLLRDSTLFVLANISCLAGNNITGTGPGRYLPNSTNKGT